MNRRKTPSKTAILELLKSSGNALSHDMVQGSLGAEVDRATIYRVLNSFCEDGKVHRIVGDDGKQYFAICSNCGGKKQVHSHDHIHFRCLHCGRVECMEGKASVPLPPGYQAKVHNLVISGLCKDCAQEQTPSKG